MQAKKTKAMNIEAYHGTLRANVKDILAKGFSYSIGNYHWLGDGVYFFIEGLGYSPDKAAELWAEYRAVKSHSQFCANLKSNIEVDDSDVLDLTSYEGIRILNYIQRRCAQKLATAGRGVGYIDGFIINFGRQELGLAFSVVKGNEYIQLEEEERRYNIRRRIPNCTICAVNDVSCISKTEITKEWRIEL